MPLAVVATWLFYWVRKIIIADGLLESFPIEKIYAIHKVLGALVGKVSARPC